MVPVSVIAGTRCPSSDGLTPDVLGEIYEYRPSSTEVMVAAGIFAIGYDTDNSGFVPKSCDITVDNFVAAQDPPPWLSFPATP